MNNLYKVRGLNGSCYVFAHDMSYAVAKYKKAEKEEYEEWVKEQDRGLSPEEQTDMEESVNEEPYSVELVCSGTEIIGEPES